MRHYETSRVHDHQFKSWKKQVCQQQVCQQVKKNIVTSPKSQISCFFFGYSTSVFKLCLSNLRLLRSWNYKKNCKYLTILILYSDIWHISHTSLTYCHSRKIEGPVPSALGPLWTPVKSPPPKTIHQWNVPSRWHVYLVVNYPLRSFLSLSSNPS